MAEKLIDLENIDMALTLFGPFDENIKVLDALYARLVSPVVL